MLRALSYQSDVDKPSIDMPLLRGDRDWQHMIGLTNRFAKTRENSMQQIAADDQRKEGSAAKGDRGWVNNMWDKE